MKTTTKAIIASLLLLLSLTASAYTVKFDAGTGVCGTTEINSKTEFELPEASHSNHEYAFCGWAIKKIDSTTTEPALLLPGSNYSPKSNITLFAVYRKQNGYQWKRLLANELSEAGIYLLLKYVDATTGKVFTGNINEGKGEVTEELMTFKLGISNNCPSNSYELNITGDKEQGFTISNGEGNNLIDENSKLKWANSSETLKTWKLESQHNESLQYNTGILRSEKDGNHIAIVSSGGYPVCYVQKQPAYTYTSTPPTSFAMSVSAAGYSTFYSSMNAFTMPEGMAGYVVNWNSENKNISLIRQYEPEAVVPADEPLVLKAAEGKYALNYVSSDAQSQKNANPTGNILIGTDVESTATTGDANNDSNYYFYSLSLNATGDMNSVGFYWVADDGAPFSVPAHKAYLALQKSLFPNGPKMMSFAFSDYETDGIASVVKDSDEEATLYNTMGQRVSKATKGIVIRNGRKYINK